jgi:hypothetical protein
MKGFLRISLFLLWILIFTLLLVYVWAHNPDIVPRPPQEFAIWLANLSNIQNGEQLANLELLYMGLISFVIALVLSLTVVYIRRKRTHK